MFEMIYSRMLLVSIVRMKNTNLNVKKIDFFIFEFD